MKVKVNHSQNLSESQELDLSLANKRNGEWIVGRSPDSDLILDNPDVSRSHGKFFFKGGNYFFCDFGSRNGSIVNGKLAVANQSYLLKDGDIIRVGDYTLVMEEIIALSEQAETVVRIISPSMFSNRRSVEHEEKASVGNQTSEIVSEVPPDKVRDESADFSTPVVEQSGQSPSGVEPPEVAGAVSHQQEIDEVRPEAVVPQLEDVVSDDRAIATPQSTIQSSDTEREAEESINNETTDAATPTDEEVRLETNNTETEEIASSYTLEIEEHPDFTYIQRRNTDKELPQPEITSEGINQSESSVREVSGAGSNEEVLSTPEPETDEFMDYTIVQSRKTANLFPQQRTVPEISNEPDSLENKAPQVDDSVITSQTDSAETEIVEVEDSITTSEPDSVETETPEVNPETTSEVTANTDLNNVENVESLTTTEGEMDILPTQVSEELSEPVGEVIDISSHTQEVSDTEEARSDGTSETSVSEYPESLREKRILLIAHESKKPELADFVTKYEKFFSLCHTIAWSSVSEVLHQQVGITVREQIPPGTSGGYQTIASLVGSGELSAVICLRDFLQPQPGQANEDAMLRLCNINQVLVATNLATAEAIVHYMKSVDS
ncbi:MAG: FHA domain-containing protein [Scytonema sp. PMC 1069.18]|nr:FHA domain-containing protein [Scytonema sp. PMC 1069.18]MEC4880013.1 FHA domain-containing protein [Scytonema sp. PMC 1070.18]